MASRGGLDLAVVADEEGYAPQRVGVVSPGVATSWKCRLGLHKFVRRHHSSDPNHQISVRCRKERIGTLKGGLFGRFGPGG